MIIPRVVLLMALTVLAGCVPGPSPATRFYSLEPRVAVPPPVQPGAPAGLAIGLGPVALPGMLDRPQIVARDGEHGVALAEFDRWAGSLEEDFVDLTARRLMHGLATARVHAHPWPHDRQLDYRVRIDVLRLDGELDGRTWLQGTWTLMDGDGQAMLTEAFDYRGTAEGSGYDALVASFSQLVTGLAMEIAERIAEHAGGGNE